MQRCEAPVTSTTTATFTALQPKDTEHQFVNVWRHEFTVTVAPDGSFSGTGNTYDNGGTTVIWAETITGSSDSDSISFKTIPHRRCHGRRDVQGDGCGVQHRG